MSQFNEVFSQYVTEKLYQNNAFLSYTKNVSEYLKGKTVHIPQYIFTGTIAVDGSNFTGASSFDVSRPFEQDLQFNINEYHFDKPFLVTDFDEALTSYQKMDVTYRDSVNRLTQDMGSRILNKWALDVPSGKKLRTTGTPALANSPLKTGARKKLTYQDVLNISVAMTEDNLPEEGRYLILDAVMYNELRQDPQVINSYAFGQPTLPNGVVAEVGGINIIRRNTISTADSSGAVQLISASATINSNRVGLAFQSDTIVRAEGGINTYQLSADPYKRGNVFNLSYWMGAINPRKGADDAGVYLIIQQ